MKYQKLIIITSILSLSLIGCGNINNKNTRTKDTIEKPIDVKHENRIPVNTNIKKSNVKTVDIQKKQKKQTFINTNNNQQMSTYTNSRFGFSIDYPKNFTLKETATNNDGAKMTLDKATITAYGYNNVLNDTAKSLYEEKLKNIKMDSIKENVIKDNYFLISWVDKYTVYYTKTVVGKESINSFTFSYPKNKKQNYDSIAKQIQKSFKTPDIDKTH